MPRESKVMDHLDAIVKINNCLNSKFLERIISLTKTRANKYLGITAKAIIKKDERNVKGHMLIKDSPTNIYYWNIIQAEITRLYPLYKAKFPLMHSTRIKQIDLLKYKVGGLYHSHVDSSTDTFRTLSIIINLNDDYKGGDLIFTNQKSQPIHRLKLGAGDIVFFPSNFLYPHAIEPITKGTRYSIVTWIM